VCWMRWKPQSSPHVIAYLNQSHMYTMVSSDGGHRVNETLGTYDIDPGKVTLK